MRVPVPRRGKDRHADRSAQRGGGARHVMLSSSAVRIATLSSNQIIHRATTDSAYHQDFFTHVSTF
jgi:hypothetical protein